MLLDQGLLDQVDGALQELVEGFATEHTVLEQGEVDELVDDVVLSGKTVEDFLSLVLLLLDGLLAVGLHIFVVLGQLVGLLARLLLIDGSETGLLTFQLTLDGLKNS